MISIVENLIPKHIALAASIAIPDKDWQWWHRYNNNDSVKYGSVDHLRFPNACRIALEEIAKTFIPPDGCFPDMDYHAGGMHMIPPEGWLGGHYDAEYHPLYSWKRFGSLVWFANEKWNLEWGGKLVVSNQEIIPEFNKAVFFETENCWHEVTRVIGPEYRKTLALFYWKKVDNIPTKANKKANFKG